MIENDKVNFTSTAGGCTEAGRQPKQRAGVETQGFNFSTLIMSLSSSADLYFGDMPDPVTGERALNLPMVEQTIEMLSMLKGKTKGNLTKDESLLIDNVLYELRMKYSRSIKETGRK